MLTSPDLPDDAIIACLRASYGLHVSRLGFLPLGWVNNAAYRVVAGDGAAYFLKLRRGHADDISVAVPAYLHAQGIREVMAPIPTGTGALWVQAHGFYWVLYPYFDGKTGFQAPLSEAQWIALGRAMSAVHATALPAALAERVPKEGYSPLWRDAVRAFDRQVPEKSYDDPIAASMAALWMEVRDEIRRIVERAEQLAQVLRNRQARQVICHADLHGNNVLVAPGGELTIVDWDAPILAPKERDLMFVGGGVGGYWNDDREAGWFYQGYGPAEIDLAALAYYRYERIVEDIAEFAGRIFFLQGSAGDRRKGLRLIEQFAPDNVVGIAHRTYQQLLGGASGRSFLAGSSA